MKRLWMLALLAILASCETFEEGPYATAQLDSGKGGTVWGKVSFHEVGDKVTVHADVRGLRPGGEFALELQDLGGCNFDIAAPRASALHAGKPDWPRLHADGEGVAMYTYRVTGLTVAPGPVSVAGRSVALREAPVGIRTSTAADAGPVVACGLIRVEN